MPGPERVLTENSFHARHWGKKLVFAGTERGVWAGTGDAPILELIDWNGTTLQTLGWESSKLAVTQQHIDGLYDRMMERAGSEDERDRFRRESWADWRAELPADLPALSRILVSDDGEIWVGMWTEDWLFRVPGDSGRTWLVFDSDGNQLRAVRIPGHMSILDVGSEWVLATVRNPLGVESLAVYPIGMR